MMTMMIFHHPISLVLVVFQLDETMTMMKTMVMMSQKPKKTRKPKAMLKKAKTSKSASNSEVNNNINIINKLMLLKSYFINEIKYSYYYHIKNVKFYLDNGAFSLIQKNQEVPVEEYAEFVREAKPDWCPIPQDFIPIPKMTSLIAWEIATIPLDEVRLAFSISDTNFATIHPPEIPDCLAPCPAKSCTTIPYGVLNFFDKLLELEFFIFTNWIK